jgi:multidrug efflux pump subunit AcrA (membrane-fusion protein)
MCGSIIEPNAVAENPGVRVPVTALAAAPDGGFQVWVFNPAAGEVNARRVAIGPVTGDTVLVEDGLAAGEQIVTAGVTALHEGMAVRPLERAVRTGSASGLF